MIKILFVCHGNICRSPMAEYLFKDLISKEGTSDYFKVESRATSTEEIGNSIYPPVKRLLASKGIDTSKHRARQITRLDYDEFDYIIYMDSYNYRNLRFMFEDYSNKFIPLLNYKDVDDPWYTRDFEKCYEEILQGVTDLYQKLN